MLKQFALIGLMGLSASAMAGQWQVKVGGSVVSPTGDTKVDDIGTFEATDELALPLRLNTSLMTIFLPKYYWQRLLIMMLH